MRGYSSPPIAYIEFNETPKKFPVLPILQQELEIDDSPGKGYRVHPALYRQRKINAAKANLVPVEIANHADETVQAREMMKRVNMINPWSGSKNSSHFEIEKFEEQSGKVESKSWLFRGFPR